MTVGAGGKVIFHPTAHPIFSEEERSIVCETVSKMEENLEFSECLLGVSSWKLCRVLMQSRPHYHRTI